MNIQKLRDLSAYMRKFRYPLWADRIDAALAEALEPVAWRTDEKTVCGNGITTDPEIAAEWQRAGWNVTKLYAAPPAPAVPEGWQVVPKSATSEMLKAGYRAARDVLEMGYLLQVPKPIYSAMLAAAPKPENGA